MATSPRPAGQGLLAEYRSGMQGEHELNGVPDRWRLRRVRLRMR
jgi:hypothetical protein